MTSEKQRKLWGNDIFIGASGGSWAEKVAREGGGMSPVTGETLVGIGSTQEECCCSCLLLIMPS